MPFEGVAWDFLCPKEAKDDKHKLMIQRAVASPYILKQPPGSFLLNPETTAKPFKKKNKPTTKGVFSVRYWWDDRSLHCDFGSSAFMGCLSHGGSASCRRGDQKACLRGWLGGR